jgi:coenzyme F420-reducing hydrogenase delta subunit
MGVGPPGRTGRDQLRALREHVLPALEKLSAAPIVAICCSEAPASHIRAIHDRGAHIHTVSCVGNLHSSVIERFLRHGAPGVMVCACPPRDCVSREGPKWLEARLYHEREAELQERVDRRRVRMGTLAPGALGASLAAYDEFARSVTALEQPARTPDVDLEGVCDAVPL